MNISKSVKMKFKKNLKFWLFSASCTLILMTSSCADGDGHSQVRTAANLEDDRGSHFRAANSQVNDKNFCTAKTIQLISGNNELSGSGCINAVVDFTNQNQEATVKTKFLAFESRSEDLTKCLGSFKLFVPAGHKIIGFNSKYSGSLGSREPSVRVNYKYTLKGAENLTIDGSREYHSTNGFGYNGHAPLDKCLSVDKIVDVSYDLGLENLSRGKGLVTLNSSSISLQWERCNTF